MARIKKGDVVAVLSGKDKGKTGKVLQVWPATWHVLVEHVNLVKHFDRKSQQNPAGGIVEREGKLALSKLALVCPKCKKGSRVSWEIGADDTKRRMCRRCKQPIDAT